ncbi:hypothetical protein HDU89_001359, partial [Geranomyces variabilis]
MLLDPRREIQAEVLSLLEEKCAAILAEEDDANAKGEANIGKLEAFLKEIYGNTASAFVQFIERAVRHFKANKAR